MTFDGFRHLLHRAVDGRVVDFKPVVGVPADEEPHIFLPVQLLLVDLCGERNATLIQSFDSHRQAYGIEREHLYSKKIISRERFS